jgi:hypothetical protein
VKRPAFWILLAIVSAAAAVIGFRYFPQAFSIVALDITMDRDRALREARAIAERSHLGPPSYRQAASFTLDDRTQTFVELEGGGKEAFTRMLRDGLYAAYTWQVRHFAEGETNETLIRFTPDGRAYGFRERLKENAPGAAFDPIGARRLAEAGAQADWHVDLGAFVLVEQAQERRPGGRIDHTFTYERPSPALNEGRYRLRLVVSGDRLTEVTHFVKIPEAFGRRYESMRSANDAIGVASVVGMMLLYVLGGIGVGMFFMLRRRMVIWRAPLVWGAIVGLLQALAAINEWPLLWMTYDTAVPRSSFFLQQVATIAAMFFGFSAFFGLSFMAAETLTRAAFGPHPQFWRVWSRGPGSSTAVLRRTVLGFLLVSVFFAYDVLLYLFTTRVFGWWSPSEALLHPDVLATYAPWLSAIANSFQAGFWEECLFRAVPLAGAALIGDRLGQRRLFLVIAFIAQALIFGAGHAPYPNQPSFARPVELIIPSIGFGLLYVYLGLLPGIILHFTFDVIWFALPIFIADAPGIRVQQFMVVALTLVPLWVVLWRRLRAGAWTELAPHDRNSAWVPPPAVERVTVSREWRQHAIGAPTRIAWLAAGGVSLVACVALTFISSDREWFGTGRQAAADAASRAVAQRGFSVGPTWRVMPVVENPGGAEHEFVGRTAGEDRRRALTGVYLPKPRWRVRIATFEGDVAARAEEWQVFVSETGEVRTVRHILPEDRAGTALDETTARARAQGALREATGLDARAGQAREVSATPAKLKARTDWTFTFADATLAPLPQGELRIDVEIAGDEVVRVGRYVYVPEDWSRSERAAGIRRLVLMIAAGIVFGGLLVASAVLGVIAWSRRRYAPAVFFAVSLLMLAASFANGVNNWPTLMAQLSTAQPLSLQVGALAGIGLVGLGTVAVLVGLALGAVPHRLVHGGTLDDRQACTLGVAIGLTAAAVSAIGRWLQTPAWARTADLSPLGTFVPFFGVAVAPIGTFLTRLAVVLALLTLVDRWSSGWTRHRVLSALTLALVVFLPAGAPPASNLTGWIVANLLVATMMVLAYTTALRVDLSVVPVSIGTLTVVSLLTRAAQRPFPGALPGSLAATVVISGVAWWLFGMIRRAVMRARTAEAASAP